MYSIILLTNKNKKMKQLSELALQSVMDLLIHVNGKTTTLEIKNELRQLGFYAEQAQVKAMVDDIFDNATPSYERSQAPGGYFEYTFGAGRSALLGHATNVDDEDDDEDDDDITFATDSYKASHHANFAANVNTHTGVVSRDPENIYYLESHAKAHNGQNDQWVVFNANRNSEFHVYNSALTRDNVRSKYASLMSCKIQDVRAKRLVHFK